jgi:prepilin-type N-terminal cleavage/methylation domain-containing protein
MLDLTFTHTTSQWSDRRSLSAAKRPRTLDRRGDTIVEVLVVLAVLGLAIGISFATANRSLLATRAAQENSQATSYLQSQVEELRYLAPASSGQNIFQNGKFFCIDIATNTVITGFTGAFTQASLTNYANYPANCVQSFYHYSIAYSPTDDTFTLRAYWDDVQGQGQDTATINYRVHQ